MAAATVVALAALLVLADPGRPWWDDRINPPQDGAFLLLLAVPVLAVTCALGGFLYRLVWLRILFVVGAAAWAGYAGGLIALGFEVREADTAPRAVFAIDGLLVLGLLVAAWRAEDAIARRRGSRAHPGRTDTGLRP